MSAGKLDELFRNWLIEGAILAGEAETEGDNRAQVAVLAYYAVHVPPYANYEVLEQWYRRLVIDRLPDASLRIREREWSRKRVDYARERLAERGES